MRIIEKCPVGCDSTLESSDILLPEGALLRCPSCGQLVSPCDAETYKRRFQPFGADNPIDKNPSVHRKRLKKIQKVVRFPPEETCLLDIGCNVGTFLQLAKKQGYLSTGVEPDAKAVEAGLKSGLDIRCGYLHEINLGDGLYDIVTLFEVVEHLEDPSGLLKECHRILKPGGFLCMTTGNTRSWTVKFLKGKWDYFDLKLGHISFFNPSSVGTVAKRMGFEVVKIETRSVSLEKRNGTSRIKYRMAKIVAEVLGLPARLLSKGQDMFVAMRKVG
jgi:SAM-dependent methyltransferase